MSANLQQEAIQPNSLTDTFDPSAPVLYADQIMGMTHGPFVSRLVFGVEDNHNRTRTSIATVVLPTNVLHTALFQLIASISTEEVREQFRKDFDTYLSGPMFKRG